MRKKLARLARYAEARIILERTVSKDETSTWIALAALLAVHGVTKNQVRWVAEQAGRGRLQTIIDNDGAELNGPGPSRR